MFVCFFVYHRFLWQSVEAYGLLLRISFYVYIKYRVKQDLSDVKIYALQTILYWLYPFVKNYWK